MYEGEVAREYLREAFHRGTLDVSDSADSLKGFVRIFAGEMEALIAIEQNARYFLDEVSLDEWLAMAQPNADALRHLKAWMEHL